MCLAIFTEVVSNRTVGALVLAGSIMGGRKPLRILQYDILIIGPALSLVCRGFL